MVFECEKVSWGLFVGWVQQILDKDPMDHFTYITKKKFDFLILSLFTQKCQRIGTIEDFLNFSQIKSDIQLNSNKLNKLGIKLSELDLAVEDKEKRRLNKSLLSQELQYASYLGVETVILKVHLNQPIELIVKKYVKFIQKMCSSQNNNLTTWLEFEIKKEEGGLDSWSVYNQIRIKCQRNFQISLRLSNKLPPKNDLRRWLAENIKNIHIPTELFKTNSQGFPILEENVEQVVTSFFGYQTKFTLECQNGKTDLSEYRNYLCFLFKNQPQLSELEQVVGDYEDGLQEPLQPYKDNLHSYTYEVFEQDPVKYDYYESAVYEYFMDQKAKNALQLQLTVVLAGAGRGGILFRIVEAARRAKVSIIFYAIEKNPYAYLTLKHHQQNNPKLKNFQFEIVLADLKTYAPEYKADLIVSELLGSFGDNELSPECLFWAQKFLKQDGTSIPCNSQSYLVPVSCPTVHVKVRNQKGVQGFHRCLVVRMKHFYVNGLIQACFLFQHPDPSPQFNVVKELQWEIKQDQLLHGMIGYFDALLYNDIKISINPSTHTPKMYSWFEVYFPFEVAVMVVRGQTLKVQIKRFNNEAKVWYEWSGQVLTKEGVIVEIPVHNKDGVHQAIDII